MKTKSIRLPDDMVQAVKLVEKREHIEEATAVRKLIRVGFETYVAELYRTGAVSLREAARRLGMNQSQTIDFLLSRGIRGNLGAADVAASMESFIDD